MTFSTNRSQVGAKLGGGTPNVIPIRTMLLVAAIGANCALSVLWPDPVMTMVAAVLFVIALRQMFSASPLAICVLLPFVILHSSVVVSLLAIESGATMKEMGATGRASTAGASYIVFATMFLVTSTWTFRHLQRRATSRDATSCEAPPMPGVGVATISLVIGLLSVAYLTIAGLKTGFPLLTGTDRFVFRSNSADIVTLNLLNMKFVIGAMLGVGGAWSQRRAIAVCHHVVFAAYLAVSFMYGDKFFIVLIAATFYLMPFFARHPDAIGRVIKRVAPAVGIIVTCVAAVTMFIYSGYGELGLNDTMTKLAGRVAGQGQLWYLAVEDSPSWFAFDTRIVGESLASVFANPAATFVFEHRIAGFYFVQKYAPSAMYMSVLHNGGAVTPTMVFEAYGLVAFGYFGLASLVAAMGVVVGWVMDFLVRSMATGNPIMVLLPAFMAAQTISLLTQATLYSVVGVGVLKIDAVFLVLRLIASGWRKPTRTADFRLARHAVSLRP